MAHPPTLLGTPMSARPWDWLFIVVSVTFASTSFLFDAMTLIVAWVTGDPLAWPLSPAGIPDYASIDPLLFANPAFLHVAVMVSGFVWGPLYVLLARGFYRRDNAIRVPGLMYGAALTLAMSMVFAEELFSNVAGWRTPNVPLYLLYNLAYFLFPLAVMWRLRRPFPFGVPTALQGLPPEAAKALGIS